MLFEQKEPSGQKCTEKHTFPLLAFCSTLFSFFCLCVFFLFFSAPLALIQLFYVCLTKRIYMCQSCGERMICVIPVQNLTIFSRDDEWKLCFCQECGRIDFKWRVKEWDVNESLHHTSMSSETSLHQMVRKSRKNRNNSYRIVSEFRHGNQNVKYCSDSLLYLCIDTLK